MAQDARVRYTRRVIQETFVELLREMPLNKVTVKEICRRGELNRVTFYLHYADPYDLMEKIEKGLLEQLEEYVEQSVADGFQKTMEGMLRQVVKNGGMAEPPEETAAFMARLKEQVEFAAERLQTDGK